MVKAIIYHSVSWFCSNGLQSYLSSVYDRQQYEVTPHQVNSGFPSNTHIVSETPHSLASNFELFIFITDINWCCYREYALAYAETMRSSQSSIPTKCCMFLLP